MRDGTGGSEQRLPFGEIWEGQRRNASHCRREVKFKENFILSRMKIAVIGSGEDLEIPEMK